MATDQLAIFLLTLALGQCAWLISVALSRLYFSPLANVPGPKLAALTSWYEFYYDVILPGRYVFKIKELHERYGPIIRVAPNDEIHINDVDFLDSIYPTSNAHKRDKVWMQTRGLDVGMSTSGTISHDLHRKRRESLTPFFSQRNVAMLESLVKDKVAQLCEHLDAARVSGNPVNLYDLYYALARDVVFQFSFGKPSDVLGDAEEASLLRRNLTQLLRGVKVSKHFHLLFRGIRLLPLSISRHLVPPGVRNMAELAEIIRGEIAEVFADESDSKRNENRSIFYELRDNPDLPALEKSPARLQSEGIMLVMAATESTAKVLAIITYHLLVNPTLLRTLRSELQTLPSTASSVELQRLPYLSAICNEGNRLGFGLTGRNARSAPKESLNYAGFTIPPGTPISMTTLCIHTNEYLFPRPWDFNPERWLGDAGRALQKYHYGFGRGSRRCLGMNLANAEVFLTIATVARYEMNLFETGKEDVEFRHDFQVAHPRVESKGIRAVVVGITGDV